MLPAQPAMCKVRSISKIWRIQYRSAAPYSLIYVPALLALGKKPKPNSERS
ncbi:protein of unknown function [Pseudorhizobium banfieldiae]|uniref:Uncharacterized protein n=1 Tax=Pseudorhizobium banfieldiae TaxID=1125847 RepID=L0NER6_9HYPH|nr:protein of unknown function [Pseudorhizobium banfieldiae]